ncbi:MAG: T9SS type A sorting domain-containing protein [Balneolaceae bacterium]
MTAKLQRGCLYKWLGIQAFLTLLLAGANGVNAQVLLQNERLFELSFTAEQSRSGLNEWVLNPVQPDSASSDQLFFTNEVSETGPSKGGTRFEGHILLPDERSPMVGFRPVDGSEEEFVRFSIRNQTGSIVRNLELRFDLSFLHFGSKPLLLNLDLQFSDGIRPIRSYSLFQTDAFGSLSEEWQPAATSLFIEELFLEPGREVELLLSTTSPDQSDSDGPFDAVALGNIEISPLLFEPDFEFAPGSLLISEIMSADLSTGEDLHYIEIYNPLDRPADLIGLMIRHEEMERVIDHSIPLAPRETVVFSSRHPDTPESPFDFILPGLRFHSDGGVVELVSPDGRVSSLQYGELNSGYALSLADEGFVQSGEYTESDLQIVQSEFANGLFGTPGTPPDLVGRTIESGTDWQIFSVPGPIEAISGDYEILPASTGIVNDQPMAWFLKGASSGEEVTVWARDSSRNQFELFIEGTEDQWIVLGNPFSVDLPFENIEPVGGEFETGAILLWDHDQFRFRPPDNGENHIRSWQPFAVKAGDATAVRFRKPAGQEALRAAVISNEERVVLRLSGMDSQGPNYRDEAVIAFTDSDEDTSPFMYRFEKVWPFYMDTDISPEGAILYVQESPADGDLYLSRKDLSLQLQTRMEIPIGVSILGSDGNFTLEWDELEWLPDEWEIWIRDDVTGQAANMRESHSLNFFQSRYTGIGPELSELPELHSVSDLDSRPRFTMIIETDPFSSLESALQQGNPDRVELYQNFPNPFYPLTNISFYLPNDGEFVSLSVYNVVGQRVALLLEETLSSGEHTVSWDANDLPSGIYIIHMETGQRVLTRKTTLIK